MRCLSPYSLIPASGHVSGIKYLNAKSNIFPVESFRRPPADFLLLGNVWLLLCLCEWHELVWQVRSLLWLHSSSFWLSVHIAPQRLSELCDVVWLLFPSCLTSSLSCKVELLTLYMQLFYVTFKKTVFLLHSLFQSSQAPLSQLCTTKKYCCSNLQANM